MNFFCMEASVAIPSDLCCQQKGMMVWVHSPLSLAWDCSSIMKFMLKLLHCVVVKNLWCQGFINWNWGLISRAFHSDKTSAPLAAHNWISLTPSARTAKIRAHKNQFQISWKFYSTIKWREKPAEISPFFPSVLLFKI